MVEEVKAELVASVLSVEVREGQPVAEGDVVVVLESMKMEIPVLTEIPGVVRRVAVHAGDSVRRGDVLAVIG